MIDDELFSCSNLLHATFVSIIKIKDAVGVVENICGQRNRDEFLSRSNVLHVSFASDCGANDYGFTAEYQEVYGKNFGGDSKVYLYVKYKRTDSLSLWRQQ